MRFKLAMVVYLRLGSYLERPIAAQALSNAVADTHARQ